MPDTYFSIMFEIICLCLIRIAHISIGPPHCAPACCNLLPRPVAPSKNLFRLVLPKSNFSALIPTSRNLFQLALTCFGLTLVQYVRITLPCTDLPKLDPPSHILTCPTISRGTQTSSKLPYPVLTYSKCLGLSAPALSCPNLFRLISPVQINSCAYIELLLQLL